VLPFAGLLVTRRAAYCSVAFLGGAGEAERVARAHWTDGSRAALEVAGRRKGSQAEAGRRDAIGCPSNPVRTARRPGLQSAVPFVSQAVRGSQWTGRRTRPPPVRSVSEDASCRALLRGEGLTDAQPREGEFHGSHRGAEPVGGRASPVRDELMASRCRT